MRTWIRLCGTAFLIIHGGMAACAEARPFSVNDDIEMVRFSDPSGTEPGSTAKFSPDGKHFAVVTSKGILKTDQIQSELLVFDSYEVEKFVVGAAVTVPLSPRIRITRAAILNTEQPDSYGATITQLRWSPDSRSLYFVGEDSRNDHRLCRLDLELGVAIPVSPTGYNVVRYDFVDATIVFSAYPSKRLQKASMPPVSGGQNKDALPIRGLSLKRVLFPDVEPAPSQRELWFVHEIHGRFVSKRLLKNSFSDISWLPEAFSISPHGRRLIQLQPVYTARESWTRYEPPSTGTSIHVRIDDPGQVASDNLWRLKEYYLVDLKTGTSKALVDAPQDFVLVYPRDTTAIWSTDEKRVLLTNTFLTLEGVGEAEQKNRLRPCAVADVELSSKVQRCILPMPDKSADGVARILPDTLRFGASDDIVSLNVALSNGDTEERTYSLDRNEWKLTDAVAHHADNASASGLVISVKQTLNQPPILWAKDVQTGKEGEIWDPNPQFKNLEFGEASVFHWKDKQDREWKGGLAKPVGYVPGRRYPLVVQIYSFDERQFLTDGDFPTAFAARHLASAGIVALQIQRKPHTFDVHEGEIQLSGIQSAIDELVKEGLVDSSKVGLVGFSSTAWYVEYALIKDPARFTAATIADGIDMSYVQYRLWGISLPTLAKEFEAMIGAAPVGLEGLLQWQQHALGFQLDHVVTPLRIEAITPTSLLSEWEIYSSLVQQGKPVDLIYFPDGQHIHQKPLERLESQQGNVDWFRFWLQGYKDLDPAKRAEYKRWEDLGRLSSVQNR